MRLLLFILLFAPASHASTLEEEGEIPPRTYIKELTKEADAALRVRVESIYLDSCRTCTSTGALYVIEADIIKKYFDKKKSTGSRTGDCRVVLGPLRSDEEVRVKGLVAAVMVCGAEGRAQGLVGGRAREASQARPRRGTAWRRL